MHGLAAYKPREVQDEKETDSLTPTQSFDSTGMERLNDIFVHGPLAFNYQELLEWRRLHWPGFTEWEAAQANISQATKPEEPIEKPTTPANPYAGMSVDDLLTLKETLLNDLGRKGEEK